MKHFINLTKQKISLSFMVRGLCLSLIVIGCIPLFGWYKQIPVLHSIADGFPPMVPNTSMGFLLCAFSLWLLQEESVQAKRRYAGQFLAFCCILLSGGTLLIYLYGVPQEMVPRSIPDLFNEMHPFVLLSSPHTSISFLLSSSALLLMGVYKNNSQNIAQWLALSAGLLPVVVLIGYLYGQKSFYIYSNIIGMSIPTALGFMMLVLGLFLARPNAILMRMLTGKKVGSRMLRKLLPTVVAVPVISGWFIVAGSKEGVFSFGYGMAIFILLVLSALISAIVRIASVLNQEQCLRNLAEEELRDSELRLHEFALYLQDIREDERTVIAHDIHDDIGNMLAALKMDVNLLSSSLKNSELVPKVQPKLDNIASHIDELIETVRRIISNLRPSVLDNLGLLDVIEWQLSEISRQHGIQFLYDCFLDQEKTKITKEGKVPGIFRIFQELMANIVRHSHASMVTVMILVIDDAFVLSVSDNGRGMNPNLRPRANAFGLTGIKQRVRSMEGICFIESKKNVGTTFLMRVPLEIVLANTKQ